MFVHVRLPPRENVAHMSFKRTTSNVTKLHFLAPSDLKKLRQMLCVHGHGAVTGKEIT
jgi:hypothetical protein